MLRPPFPADAATCSNLPVLSEIVDDDDDDSALAASAEQQQRQMQQQQQQQQQAGAYTGQVKWWNDKLGYGFATVCAGPELGREVFVHHTGIRPAVSSYRTLRKGEYVCFNIAQGHNGHQAVDVTGVLGGSLMCDVRYFFSGGGFAAARKEMRASGGASGGGDRVE